MPKQITVSSYILIGFVGLILFLCFGAVFETCRKAKENQQRAVANEQLKFQKILADKEEQFQKMRVKAMGWQENTELSEKKCNRALTILKIVRVSEPPPRLSFWKENSLK